LIPSSFFNVTEKSTLEKILDDEDSHTDGDGDGDGEADDQDSQHEGNYTSPTITVA
jgi:hypothetical protein